MLKFLARERHWEYTIAIELMKRSLAVTIFVLASWRAAWAETAQEIADGIIFARGGKAKLQSIQSGRITGIVSMEDEQGTFVLEWKHPQLIRMEITLGGKTIVKASDGQNAWKLDPLAGSTKPVPMDAVESKRFMADMDFDGPFLDPASKGVQIELIDKEMLDPSLVWKLKVTHKSGEVEFYYVESTGHFVLLKESAKTEGSKAQTQRQYFRDFQMVGDLWFPFTTILSTEDSTALVTLSVQDVELNPKIEETRFRLSSNSAAAMP